MAAAPRVNGGPLRVRCSEMSRAIVTADHQRRPEVRDREFRLAAAANLEISSGNFISPVPIVLSLFALALAWPPRFDSGGCASDWQASADAAGRGRFLILKVFVRIKLDGVPFGWWDD